MDRGYGGIKVKTVLPYDRAHPQIYREGEFFSGGVSLDEIVSHGSYLEKLKTLRDEAREEGCYSAAFAAEIAKGKAAGLYTEPSGTEGEIRMVWAET